MSAKPQPQYYCPEREMAFNHWELVSVSPHGNGVFECPHCGVNKRDSTGTVRDDHHQTASGEEDKLGGPE